MDKITKDLLFQQSDYFAYEEAGFDGEWRHYNYLIDAIENVSYDNLYLAIKIPLKTIKQLKAIKETLKNSQ